MKIALFGQLKELAPNGMITVPSVSDSNELRALLEEQFPLLQSLPYLLAIDKKITTEQTQLTESQEIAILPPYSGG